MNSPFPQIGQQDQEKLKSYWNRPGGKFGVIAGIGILIALGYYVLPILTTVVWNTLNFGIALGSLGIFLYAITHRKLRLSAFYLYEILMKKLIGVVIQLDSFIIAEDYIKDIMKERENLLVKANDVSGQKETIDLKIKDKGEELQMYLDRANTAKKSGDTMAVGNAIRQVERIKDYIKQLKPIQDNLDKINEYLMKVYKNSAYLLEDMRNELDIKKDLYQSVTKGNKALQSALKIFNGDPEKKLLVEQSMEYLKEDIGNKLASMKSAISITSDFMKTIDLDNATFEEKGLRMLDEYNPDTTFKLLIGDNTSVAQPIKYTPGIANTTQYDNLIN